MRAEYYADVYRRFATFLHSFGENRLFRIACGAHDIDYLWTEVLMREAARWMDGLSLHYYTVPGSWESKGSAVDFTEEEWFATLKKALRMDELVSRHATIMDRYDPERRIALVVDEWGTWYDPEPGTNPGFLVQQNTIRDALAAGLTLNIFNNYCQRVRMANLAQTVNVLQSVIQTDEEKLLLTPTYHVFEMYSVHQDALQLPVTVQSDLYQVGEDSIPAVRCSASLDEENRIHLSICHTNPGEEDELEVTLRGFAAKSVSGRILAAKEMNQRNTFENPDAVKPQPFDDAVLAKGKLRVKLPPMSVAVLEIY
jgi:alpha-N-arabinofuranosidase